MMKMQKAKVNLLFILSLALGLVVPAVSSAQDQPLGTVARQQRAQQKSRKVITDEDMPTRASERSNAPAETANADARPAPEADKGDKTDKKAASDDKAKSEPAETTPSTPESEDSPAAAPIRQKLNNLKNLEGLLQKQIAKVEKAMAEDSDENNRAGYKETIEAQKKSLAETREKITETEKELAEANK
jgi:hypothetical protein